MMTIDEVMQATEEKAQKETKRQVLFGDMLRSDLGYHKKDYAKRAIEWRAPGFVDGVKEFFGASELGKREDVKDIPLHKARIVRGASSEPTAFLETTAGTFMLRRHAFDQIAREMNAPPGYLVTLPPVIALDCLEYGFKKMPDTMRTLRVENGEVRAVVSKRYAPLDDRQACRLLYRALERSGRLEQAQIESWSVGKTSSLTVSFGDKSKEILDKGYAFHGASRTEGLGLRASVNFRNAELGNGSASLRAALRRHWCSNGVLVEAGEMTSAWTRRHTGDWEEQAKELADAMLEIIETANHVLKNAVPGALADVFKPAELEARLKSLKLTKSERESVLNTILAEAMGLYAFEKEKLGFANQQAVQDAAAVMAELEKAKVEDEREAIFEALAFDVSGWNVVNGVTAVARDLGDADRAIELEALGGKLLAEYLKN